MLKYSITALALVAGSTFALADPNPGGANGPGSSSGAMEHSGSTSGGATKGNGLGGDSGAGHTGGAQMGGTQMNRDRSTGDSGAGQAKENTRSNEGFAKPDRQAKEGNEKSNKHEAQDRDRNLKSDNRQARDNDRGDRNERMGADQSRNKSKAGRSSTGASEGVEGKGGARGSITNVTSEQRTRARSVFLNHRVAPARDINVAVNVGVRVPRSVHFYPIPEDIVTIVPDYRGYEYFMIDDAHVAIVDPDTLEVVDIIVVA